MDRVISALPKIVVRIITFSLVLIAFFFNTAINSANSFQAQAAPLTPEATKDQVNSQDSPFRENDQEKVNALFKEYMRPQTASETTKELGEAITKPQKTIKKNLENAAETARENLNLNQPPYTKLDEIAEEAVNSVRQN